MSYDSTSSSPHMRLLCACLAACMGIGVISGHSTAQETMSEPTLRCKQLATISLPNMSISLPQSIPAGELKDIPIALAPLLPEFCRVAATLRPTKDSEIKIEVWLPASSAPQASSAAQGWNGRLQSVGNGGLAGSISYAAMAAALRDRYATASTDTGHTGSAVSGEWAVNHPEKILDFGHRAAHEMTVAAKALIKQFYGRPQHHAYWNGCSEGGNQALHEAQRYPQDYDGILAGAPANYMTHLQTGGLWISHAIHKDPESFIPGAKLPAINQAVLTACDSIDGLQDGIVDDPRACTVDLAQLRCGANDHDRCLTVAQLNGLRKVYGGAKHPVTAKALFPGYSYGSELEWGTWIAGNEVPPKNRQHLIADNLFKYMVFQNADWDWQTFDFAKDVVLADQRISAVNSIDPNLRPFKERGGKLLQYHGWYDPAISPLNSIDYFSSVQKQMGNTQDFYRLYMIPGMGHCGGGPGVSEFDKMDAIVQWVEQGKPPALVASRKPAESATRTRPLCAFPKMARYKGSGNSDDAVNFTCISPR